MLAVWQQQILRRKANNRENVSARRKKGRLYQSGINLPLTLKSLDMTFSNTLERHFKKGNNE